MGIKTLEKETGIHAKNVKDYGNDSQYHSNWVKYELYTDTQRNCGFLLGRSSGDSDAASFPDVKTLEAAGFENYDDGYRLLIESEKKG